MHKLCDQDEIQVLAFYKAEPYGIAGYRVCETDFLIFKSHLPPLQQTHYGNRGQCCSSWPGHFGTPTHRKPGGVIHRVSIFLLRYFGVEALMPLFL